MRNISAWAIKNPVPSIVMFVALTLAGLLSFMRLDVNNEPDVDFPMVQIMVAQPSAAASELEAQVTRRVEAAARSIAGVDEISSFVNEGSSMTSVQFDMGVPVDRAVNDVRNAIDMIRGDLPEGILEPQVSRVDIDDGPIALISAEATDMTLEELSWYVDNTVAKRLLGVSGMAAVGRRGGVDREIRIVLDPARMQAQGITAAQVNQQLRLVNVNAAGGRVAIAGSEQSIRVLGNSSSAYALGETQISVGGGRTVKLAEIARAVDGHAEQRSLAKMNGKQVLSFGLEPARGASDVSVYDESHKVLDELEKENPKVRFTELYTSVDYTKDQYHSAIASMIEGALLAVFVVFLFLRDMRATLISALAIPLSVIPAFWFMDMMGFTLNFLSLLALSLVSGVLVDDAIVEIENIVRHMRMGKTAYQASLDAADEIGLAVVATTMSIVAVFLPVGLMPGITGQFFKQFGLTVVVTVLISLAVARLVTPMIAAYFLKADGHSDRKEAAWVGRYESVLRWSLANRWKTIGVGVLALVATVVAYGTLPSAFQPTIDTDFSRVNIELPPGSTLARTESVADEVVERLRARQEVAHAYADIRVGRAQIFLTLKKERERSSVEFERDMQPQLAGIADARIAFLSQMGGSGRDITIMIASDDPAKLGQAASRLVAEMGTLAEIRAPRIDGQMRRPEIVVKPRLDLAAQMGVTTSALSQTIRIATLGEVDQNSAKFSLSDRQIPIRVLVDAQSRTRVDTIENLPVPTQWGGSVPLKTVAEIGFASGPTEVRRFAQKRRVMITADLAPGLVSSDAMSKINALPAMANLPVGVEKVKFGASKMEEEMITNFFVAVVSGILLVFAVLVLLYKKVMSPFVNMGSLLLAPLGGAVALHLTGHVLSMPVFIGILMLLGIVAKNSILLIDFAIEEIDKGVDKDEAILDAGRKRVQPIVMTTVAMVAGMVPTALALVGDGAWRAPMGVTVIGGLILSTLLTLLIVPAGFSMAHDLEKWLGSKFGKVLTHRRPAPEPAVLPAE